MPSTQARLLETMRARRLAKQAPQKRSPTDPSAMLARARETEAAIAEAVLEFLLPERTRTLKSLIDIVKSFGVILGIIIFARYLKGNVPRAFTDIISPGVQTEVTSALAHGFEYFAAILFLLVILQSLAFIWRPFATVPLKWIVQLSTRTFPEFQAKRWKRLAVSAIDGAVNALIVALLLGVVAFLAHFADLEKSTAGDQIPRAGAALTLKLDYNFGKSAPTD